MIEEYFEADSEDFRSDNTEERMLFRIEAMEQNIKQLQEMIEVMNLEMKILELFIEDQ